MTYYSPVTMSAGAAIAAYAANRNMSSVMVSDASASIAANLDALNALARAGKITSVALNDLHPLQVTDGQMTSDSQVLGLLPFGYTLSVSGVSVTDASVLQANPNVASIAVSDSPAAVMGTLGALNSDSKVGSVNLVGGAVLAISYSQYGAYSRVLGGLSPDVTLTVSGVPAAAAFAVQADARVTGFSIADATTNVAAVLTGLASDGKLASIMLSDHGAMALTFAQYSAGAAVLAKLPGSSTVTVAAVPVAQAVALQGSTRVSGFSVSDTAAAIGGALPSLMTAAKLSALTITDGSALALTYAQISLYGVLLHKLTAGSTMTASGVSVAQAGAAQQNQQVGSFTVLDSSSAVVAALDALNGDSKVSAIVLTDTNPLAVSYVQSTADGVALGKLPAGYSLTVDKVVATAAAAMQAGTHVAAFSVADTAVNVSATLDALNTDTKLTAITVTDSGLVTISMAQLFADSAAMQKLAAGTLLAVSGVSAMNAAAIQSYSIVTSLSVTDTAANVSVALGELAGDSKLTGIVLADKAALAVTAWAMSTYASVFAKLPTNYQLTASGALVAEAAALQANAHVASFTVADSAIAVAAGFDALNNDGSLVSIAVEGSPSLALSYGQWANNTAALAKLAVGTSLALSGVSTSGLAAVQADGRVTAFSVADTAADIQSALTLLNSAGGLTAIMVNDAALLTIDVSQLAADQTALAKLTGSYNLIVTGVLVAQVAALQASSAVAWLGVRDTAATISGALAALGAAGKVTSLTVMDGNALPLSDAQLTAYGGLIATLTPGSTLAVSSVPVSHAATVQNDAAVASFSISSPAATVAAALGTLNGDTKLSALALSDGGTIPLTYAGLTANSVALGKLTSASALSVSAVAVAQAAAMQGDARVGSFAVADSATTVQSALGNLNADSKLTGISLTGGNTLLVTATQFAADTVALGKLSAGTVLALGGVTAVGAGAAQANAAVASFSVSDTAANVLARLDALNGDGKLSAITLTNGSLLAISYAQWMADSVALGKLSAGYKAVVSGVPTSAAATIQASSIVASFSISSPAATVAAALGMLNGDTKLSALALSDGGTIPLTYAGLTANSVALGKLTSASALSVSAVAVAQAAAMQGDARVGSFAVADSATTVQSALGNLNADSKLTGISLTGGNTLLVTATQFAADTVALGKLSAGTVLALGGVTAVGAGAAQANAAVASFSVSDTAANVLARLDALNGDGKLSAITLTNGSLLAISYAQWMADSVALGKLSAGCKMVVSGVPTAAAAAMQASSIVASFSLTANSADVTASRASLGLESKLTAVVLTDGTPLAMTYADLQSQSVAILRTKLPLTYALIISAAPSAAACATLQGIAQVVSYSMAASAATITASLAALVSDTRLTAIAALPGAAVTVTSAQFSANTPVLNKLSTTWTITGVSAASATSVQQGSSSQASFSVSDSSINVVSALAALSGYGKLVSISLTDTKPLALVYAQFAASTVILGKLQAGYTLAVSGATVGNAAALQANPHVATFALNDTAVSIIAALPALNADSKLTAVTVSDGQPLALTYTGFATYTKVLGGLQGSYALTVSQAAASAAAVVTGNSHVTGLSVVDTLAGIGANLSSLETLAKAGSLTAIAVSDVGASLTLSATQAFAYKDALSLMAGKFSIMETGTSLVSATTGLNAAGLSFIGTPAVMVLGSGVTVTVGLAPTSGIEEITNFQYGSDHLSVDLQGLAANRLMAFDTSVGGQHAIALASSANQTHGIVLLGMGTNAADLMAHHLTFINGSAIVT